MRILVTGVAGFIGYSTALRLLSEGMVVVGVDNLNDYYDVSLKEARLRNLVEYADGDRFIFIKADISDQAAMDHLFKQYEFAAVVHLAAQAGVRYSLLNPHVYAQSNLVGFLNILEGCRAQKVGHLVYASSSSVYGLNSGLPFTENCPADHQVSFYGATKRANELMAHSYSSLYGLSTTGLRFFTVYGPWGRPDMALFKFTKAILADEQIEVFNYGEHYRDFTYVDDIVTGVVKVMLSPAQANPDFSSAMPDAASSSMPWRLYNIGNNTPIKLTRYIEVLEQQLGKRANIKLLPLQVGDVPDTYADVTNLEQAIGYRPSTSVEVGVKNFLQWYLRYYADALTV